MAKTTPSHKPHSGGLTGGVCKEQGRIHRAMLKRDYYGFQLHEGEFQPSIITEVRFEDCLLLSELELIVLTIAARVWPRRFGAY